MSHPPLACSMSIIPYLLMAAVQVYRDPHNRNSSVSNPDEYDEMIEPWQPLWNGPSRLYGGKPEP